jgi:hypothetical protein
MLEPGHYLPPLMTLEKPVDCRLVNLPPKDSLDRWLELLSRADSPDGTLFTELVDQCLLLREAEIRSLPLPLARGL